MDVSEIDPETLSLMVQLHLDDLKALKNTVDKKGKGREGEVTDLVVAIEAYQDSLSDHAQILSDQAMSQSIGRAVLLDAETIRALRAEEERDRRDREMALRLSGTRNVGPPAAPGTLWNDKQSLGKRKAPEVGPANDQRSASQAESSSWAANRRQQDSSEEQKAKRSCIACGDEHHRVDTVACTGCSHRYCRGCLESLFQASLKDETLFPPKCCGKAIPVDICRPLLPVQLVGEFSAKVIEFATPNRTYCSQPTCSTFVLLRMGPGVSTLLSTRHRIL